LFNSPGGALLRMTAEATAALAGGLPNLGRLQLHGYEFPGDTLAPLLAAGERLWVTADPRRVEAGPLREGYVERAGRIGWLPPLDAYQEEEEPFP
jgi:hypothetical protein